MPDALLLTADPALHDVVARCAAAAGVGLEPCADPAEALARWSAAPLVLVDAAAAAALTALVPGRRDGVHVITRGRVADEVFRLAVALGAETVSDLEHAEGWLMEQLTDLGDHARPPGLVVGVLGGSGGAGATTLAVALGQVGARGAPTLLVDADPLGPGLDRLVGLERRHGARWEALCHTTGRLSARALRDAVPRQGRLGVLTWGPGEAGELPGSTVREAVSAARRGHDLVVVDLPRVLDAAARDVLVRCDRLVVVVSPTLVGVAAAARVCARSAGTVAPVLVVRRPATGPVLSDREVAAACRHPVVVSMPSQRGLAESVDLGLGPVRSPRSPLARAARTLHDQLGAAAGSACA